MIEKLSKEEIKSLIEELKEIGCDVRVLGKSHILNQEAEKLGMVDAYIGRDLKTWIFRIADFATDNTDVETGRVRKEVPVEIEGKYRRICYDILKTLKPYYGKLGFRRREDFGGRHE